MKSNVKIFDILVIEPIQHKQLKHVGKRFFALASSPKQAEKAVRSEYNFGEGCFIKVDERDGYDGKDARILRTGFIYTYSKEDVSKLRGLPPKAPKPAAKPKLSKRKLGDTQKSVLNSLTRSPYPGGGWLWDTHSGTVRILESLRLRCLVDFKDDRYKINKAGLAALRSE